MPPAQHGQARRDGQYTRADLDPGPQSAAVARRITRDALTRWNLPDDITDDAELIASELAANASTATPPGSPAPAIILTLHYQHPDLTIRMWDIGPGEPSLADPGDDAEDGRGLMLISRLSQDWGWWPCPHSGGKVVFSTLTTHTKPDEDNPVTAADALLAQLRASHAARWDIWLVPCTTGQWWCCKPAGTPIGIHHETTPKALDAWICRVDGLTDSGFTITFDGTTDTATVTWTPPGTRTPATYGPASIPQALTHAEDIRARRLGMITWLTEDPEGTARHMADAQIRDLIPDIHDADARRVLEAITTERAAPQAKPAS